ncbi:MAG TPA: aspartate kinase [Bacillota bacterium]|jgi:aspartate kinase
MRIVVQKFGGTSVSTPEQRDAAVGHILEAIGQGFRPAVVVSAMGRAGDPYATDTLLRLPETAGLPASPREQDLIASCGEIISSVMMVNTLRGRGLEACAFTGGQAGIFTDHVHTGATITKFNPTRILQALEDGKVAVVAGFQGITEDGEITTLGRGGSDTTAAALGVALRAEVVEIYTDVEGVKTADPRIVPGAKTIEQITYHEISQMAHEGAKVVHPAAVEIAMARSIPLRVRSTFSQSMGTLITAVPYDDEVWPSLHAAKVITGVTQMPGMAQIRLDVPPDGAGVDPLRIFSALAQTGISVDLINVSPERISFIVKEDLAERARTVLAEMDLAISLRRGCAKVSVVGTGMRGVPGVMANVVKGLAEAGVRILQTSDSHLTISCLLDQADMEKAVRALHEQFGLGD